MSDLELIIQAAKLGAAGSDNCNQVAAAIERITDATLSDLLQDCRSLFLKIADEDDKDIYPINHNLRRELDTLLARIQQTI